jgi:hypothetical protein
MAESSAKHYGQKMEEKEISLISLRKELEESLEQLNQMKINKIHDREMYVKDCKELTENKLTLSKNLSELGDRIEVLQNEIDGLNVDKLHLKSELAKYRAIHEKRKAQKAANMRRFRPKQKEAKG